MMPLLKPSPLVAGHIEVRAQCSPHIARVHAVLDGLSRRAPESGQHMVDEQGSAAHLSELPLDEFTEFGQSHSSQPTPVLPAPRGTPVPDPPPRRPKLRPAAPPPGIAVTTTRR